MRLLANENFPGPVVRELRRLGHDVAWILELQPSAPDELVLARAQLEGRTLVTFDKDFGLLAFRAGLPHACGVVLLRLNGSSPEVDNARALEALTSQPDWSGQFVVVEDERIRVRPLP
ncbi:MAG: DUF5615 family PIN-like protein [Planctomycetes bacterium]|nr:DUF5615 family PIN-like protein [Planctomycetota bacterium]